MSSSGTTRRTGGWRFTPHTYSSRYDALLRDRPRHTFREDRRRFQASLGACAAASAAARAHVFDDEMRRTTRECLAVAVAAFVVPEAASTADEVVAEATSTADEVMGCG